MDFGALWTSLSEEFGSAAVSRCILEMQNGTGVVRRNRGPRLFVHPFVALGNRDQTFEQINILGYRKRAPNTGTQDKKSHQSFSSPHEARNRKNGSRCGASWHGLVEETSAVRKTQAFSLFLSKADIRSSDRFRASSTVS